MTKETETIDYDELERLAREHKPKMIVAGASAYSRIIDFPRMAKIAQSVRRRCSSWTWRTSPAWWRRAFIRVRCRTPISFRRRRTRRCAARAAGWFCAAKSTRRISTASTFPGIQGGPLEHIIAAKAVCLKEAMEPEFREYQKQVVANAQRAGGGLAKRGFRIVTGGTDTHLFLVDMHSRGITGRDAELALDRAGMTVNKNAIPFDPLPPLKAGGIRVGSPAVTTRGMREPEMEKIAAWIADVLTHLGDTATEQRVRGEVAALAAKFPLYARRLEAADVASRFRATAQTPEFVWQDPPSAHYSLKSFTSLVDRALSHRSYSIFLQPLSGMWRASLVPDLGCL